MAFSVKAGRSTASGDLYCVNYRIILPGFAKCRKALKNKEKSRIRNTKPTITQLQTNDIHPFSLFREYLAQLIKYNKKFLIIGNQNAITYKEVFPLIAQNKLWLGSFLSYIAFKVPDSYEERATRFWIDKDGQKWRSMGNICWYTNLDIPKRHENLILYKHYTPEEYPKYDNYDAINVDKTADIPCDYYGNMGVPITFMDKYNPEQFEIIGCTESEGKGFSNGLWDANSGVAQPMINGKRIYKRIFIRRRRNDKNENSAE